MAADYHTAFTAPPLDMANVLDRNRAPQSVHWSIAWSDVMMTMFILFLTLFVYQLAQREFLAPDKGLVLAGSVLSVPPKTDPFATPFHPISPQLSRHKADRLKLLVGEEEKTPDDLVPSVQPQENSTPEQRQLAANILQSQKKQNNSIRKQAVRPPIQVTSQRAGTAAEKPTLPKQEKEIITEIYDLSRLIVGEEKLDRFAAIELIPDKAMRIVLTGDLLFATGETKLTPSAKQSLGKLSPFIARTPYMINVVGHTDATPMHSAQYPTNWELSVARASTVARFLIQEMGVPGSQIVVSGFSSFRPVRPNTNEENMRANRRVEIILSRDLPPVMAADQI